MTGIIKRGASETEVKGKVLMVFHLEPNNPDEYLPHRHSWVLDLNRGMLFIMRNGQPLGFYFGSFAAFLRDPNDEEIEEMQQAREDGIQ